MFPVVKGFRFNSQMQKTGILNRHKLIAMITICFFIASGKVCNAYSRTEETTASTSACCGFPEEVRDGLHPYQYYALAKYYLGNFNFERAKLCVQRLRSMKSNKEALNLAEQIEKSLMPKFPVPEEAMKKFKAVTERKEKLELCKELTERFPNFEWPYLALAWSQGFGERSFAARTPYLKKVIEINPHNVQALMALSDIAWRSNESAQAFKYLQEAEKYYPEIVNTLNYKRLQPPTKSEAVQQKQIKRYNDRIRAKTIAPPQIQEQDHIELTYHFIDKTGNRAFRVGPNAEVADKFSDGLLLVNGSENRGSFQSPDVQYWNRSGDLVFSTGHSDGASASEGLCAIQRQWGSDHRINWGFCDKEGRPVIVPKEFFCSTKSFHNERAAIEIRGKWDFQFEPLGFGEPKWGFIDKTVTWQAEPIYNDVNSFCEGRAAVSLKGKVGFIDQRGFFVIPPRFDMVRSFSEGLANVVILDEANRTWDDQYIDLNGKLVFHELTKVPGEEPLRKYASEGMLSGFDSRILDFNMVEIEEKSRKWDFHNGVVVARVETKYGYKNREGKFVIQPKFENAFEFSDGLAMVMNGGKYGFINRSGQLIVPTEYQLAKSFSDGLAAVSQDGKNWGYIDKQGKLVIEMKYLEAKPFAEGLAKVGIAK